MTPLRTNSSVFSVIGMHRLPSAKACGDVKLRTNKILPFLTGRAGLCRLICIMAVKWVVGYSLLFSLAAMGPHEATSRETRLRKHCTATTYIDGVGGEWCKEVGRVRIVHHCKHSECIPQPAQHVSVIKLPV